MDAVLRFVSLQSFQTVVGLMAAVPDDSSDPVRRIRTVLGKLVWKRNQLAQIPVQTEWSDLPVWKSLCESPLFDIPLQIPPVSDVATGEDDKSEDERNSKEDKLLVRYLQGLHQTELQLRSLVLQHLTEIPVAIIATAADERSGTMESMDDTDFEDASSIQWVRPAMLKQLNSPAQLQSTDDLSMPVVSSPGRLRIYRVDPRGRRDSRGHGTKRTWKGER
jgi:hypothetical protein